MLNYDAKAKTISSKFKTYELNEIDEVLMYQWIKSGDLCMKAFEAWSAAQRAEAFADGAESEALNYAGSF